MSIYIQAQQVLVQQPQARGITPNMIMNNPTFQNGYLVGLNGGLHPDNPRWDTLTDEEIVEDIKRCVVEEPEILPYVIGNWVGLIIAKCH